MEDHYRPVVINNKIRVLKYHISSNRQRLNIRTNDFPYQQSLKKAKKAKVVGNIKSNKKGH